MLSVARLIRLAFSLTLAQLQLAKKIWKNFRRRVFSFWKLSSENKASKIIHLTALPSTSSLQTKFSSFFGN
jgi:hypothetical protein